LAGAATVLPSAGEEESSFGCAWTAALSNIPAPSAAYSNESFKFLHARLLAA
jgi:hypothetical protein